MNLRTRILKCGIRCTPWHIWKGEIRLMPISSQTLFRKNGIPIDILEMELISECYLFENECLLEVLKDADNLKRYCYGHDSYEDSSIGGFPDDWDEEDYMKYDEDRF